MSNSEYGIFTECRLMGINEGIGAAIAFGAAIGLAAIYSFIDDRKKNKVIDAKEKERLAKYANECKKRNKDNENFIADVKKYYSILNLQEIESSKYENAEKCFDDMLKDVKVWVKKILNSQIFKNAVTESLIDDGFIDSLHIEYDENFKPSISHFKSLFKVEEGVNGYEESMQIIDGSQTENVYFSWVIEDIARMIEIKYKNYVKNVSTGDGDEGHLYYTIKV